jgi:putative spermidine/putrescine transport system ATP-binding protein
MSKQSVAVRLEAVSRHFGEVRALDAVSLEICDGEFFCLLGPSGSGKTTALRLIAGFDHPTSGRIYLHGRDVSNVPPYERQVNTVFQDYALFPHMTVAQNIAYGLKVKGVPRPVRERRVQEMLDLVQLPGIGERKPSQLSGGQRQRVALARALVNQPEVLLLDEPLGALDLKLRQQMQIELKTIQQHVGITFIFVTHDQEEALTMSDRIAVFNHGQVEQVGSPAHVYEMPATPFVADFLGTSNLLEGALATLVMGEAGLYSIRPEKIHLQEVGEAIPAGQTALDGIIQDVTYLGLYTRYSVEVMGGARLSVVRQNLKTTSMDVLSERGRAVKAVFDPVHVRPLHEV